MIKMDASRIISTLLALAMTSTIAVAEENNQATSETEQTPYEPTSHYTIKNMEGWKVWIYNDLLPGGAHAETGAAAIKQLREDMVKVRQWMPDKPLKKLLKVGVWLELDSTNGPHGRTPVFHYHPGLDWLVEMDFHPGKHKCVEYSRAAALLKKRKGKTTAKTLLHELAHAYHDQILGFDDPDVLAAHKRAREDGKYPPKDWVVRANHKEFFAGVTTRYFGVKEERDALVERDPILLKYLQTIWDQPKAYMDTPSPNRKSNELPVTQEAEAKFREALADKNTLRHYAERKADQRDIPTLIVLLRDEKVKAQAGAVLRDLSGELLSADFDRWSTWWDDIQHPTESAETLVARLRDPRIEIRRPAIMKLGFLRDPATLDGLIDLFLTRRKGRNYVSGDGTIMAEEFYAEGLAGLKDRKLIKVALIQLGEPAVPHLIPITSYNWGIREDAREVLAALESAPTQALIDALKHQDYKIRTGAARTLEQLRPLEAVIPLVKLARGPQGHQRAAYSALVAYDKRALPFLKQSLKEPELNEFSRIAAAVLMANFGDRSEWERLERAIATGSRTEMNGAVSNIGKTKNPVFLPLLAKAFSRKDAEQSLPYALAYCGGAKAIPLLKKALDHPNGGVQSGAEMWLKELSSEARP